MATAIVRLATMNTFGRNIIRQAGYGGEMRDWQAYALWLGQAHRLRLWGELVSNSMVVIKEFLLYCKQEMGNEPWEADSIEDGDLAAFQLAVEDGNKVLAGEHYEDHRRGKAIGPHKVVRDRWSMGPRVMGAALDVEELRQMIDGWKEQCVLCKIQGRIARGHRWWSDCNEDGSAKKKMQEVIHMLEDV